MTSTDQLQANRENAQLSTGPTSDLGRARSSQNALQHGLASGRLILDGESPEEFEKLHQGFLADHQPADNTEAALVHDMARHRWLMQRATTLQSDSFDRNLGEPPANLSVLIRYETTHERAFHKSLATLRSIQKDRKKQATQLENGFVSQEEESIDKRNRLKLAIARKSARDGYQGPEPGQPDYTDIDLKALCAEIDAATDEELHQKYGFLLY